MEIHGTVASGFGGVAELFAAGLAEGADVGAALSVAIDGEFVLDIWGGHRDQARTEAWEEDTICPVMSVGKGWLAVLAMTLIQSGDLDLERSVTHYWPEFGANDKAHITVQNVLTHTAGLPFHDEVPAGGKWTTHDDLAAVLARQAPMWADAEVPAYHPLTIGTLLDALIRRVTGGSAADCLCAIAEERDLAVSFGISPAHRATRAEAGPSTIEPGGISDGCTPDPRCKPCASEPRRTYELVNSDAFGQTDWPSINGFATARGLAGFYAAAIDSGGSGLLTARTVSEMTTLRWADCERTGGQFMRMGLGVNLGATDSYWFGRTDAAFGHVGKGGSTGFADPTRELAVGYVTNSHYEGAGSGPRLRTLAQAIDLAVGRTRP